MLSKMAYFGAFFCGFPYFLSISLNFLLKYYTWLESSCIEDSNATFPKLLGGTSKDTDFLDDHGKEVCFIAENLS